MFDINPTLYQNAQECVEDKVCRTEAIVAGIEAEITIASFIYPGLQIFAFVRGATDRTMARFVSTATDFLTNTTAPALTTASK